ncbi:MAG: hypothetical protein ACJ8G2_05525 [Burkholderiales bacterium]|jgi:hypothetical protein
MLKSVGPLTERWNIYSDDPMTQTTTVNDIYTRKVGGERYEYEVTYTPGERVAWNARVYQNGILKGTPGGVETGNRLEGEALRESIISLVEVAIEGMQGIRE